MPKQSCGFTLIELVIAVAIIAILAAVAYPAYTDHVRKAHRSEIAALLLQEAHTLERFHSRAGQYTNTPGPPAREHDVQPGNALYAIDAERMDHTFTLRATPLAGTLMSDDACGRFVVTHTGRRDNPGLSGDASVEGCWGR